MMSAPPLFPELAPTPAAYLRAAGRVRAGEFPELRPLRVAVLATVAAQVLEPFLVVEGAARGWRIEAWFGPFGQLEAQALEAASALYAQRPEAIVILARIEELAPAWAEEFLSDPAVAEQRLEELAERWRALLGALRARTDAKILAANFAPPKHLAAGLADAALAPSQTAGVQRANDALAAACQATPDAFVFDCARLVAEHGLRAWHDARLFALARQPWSVGAQIALARGLARSLRAAFVPPAKCLVLDADDTLWGGVLGEEGPGGIALGEEFPGSVFKGFQKYLRTLKQRGVLLALASKNNEAEVLEVLERHPDGVLRREDFAAVRINWREKSANLAELAAELNLGLESLVFFDDSPFEREEVRRALPMVQVIEAPADALAYREAIEESGFFDQLVLSAEDRRRGELYQSRAAGAVAQRAAGSPEEFLASLEMVATIGAVDAESLPRVAQLLAKTNQFNLTTRRHTAAQLAAMIAEGAVALWLRLADRFGDHGLVGVALAQPDGVRWRIDTFLLSCRVIGRGAETALLAELASRVVARGATELVGEYLPTGRNELAADFYARHGFAPAEGCWKIDPARGRITSPKALRIDLA